MRLEKKRDRRKRRRPCAAVTIATGNSNSIPQRKIRPEIGLSICNTATFPPIEHQDQ